MIFGYFLHSDSHPDKVQLLCRKPYGESASKSVPLYQGTCPPDWLTAFQASTSATAIA
ncbi:hypothetical protein [Scytonema sp. PRP1]|uniref:hypothetical protein n=1 Tax=Scytonema sp. PRP1 TaxID=3120513 RepID=UPI002FCF4039